MRQDDKASESICFHCSQTIDNFHNFATKIKAIQNIIFPTFTDHVELEGVSYEICLIPPENSNKVVKPTYETNEHVKDNVSINDLDHTDTEEWTLVEPITNASPKLLQNGLLLYKGDELMTMMSQFFNTTCEICSKQFKIIKELFRHQKTEHSIVPYISCCSSKLTKTPAIIWH